MGRRPLSGWTRGYLGLVTFSLAGSLLSRVTGLNPGPIASVAGALTLIVGVVAAFCPVVLRNPRAWWAVAGVFALGTVVELVGVGTGFPFGAYAYTDRWWPAVRIPGIGWFPLLIPLAWGLMAGASALTVRRLWPRVSGPSFVLGGGLLAAVLDLGMEPVMVDVLGYWTWLKPGPLPGGAPVPNFLGWFGTAALAAFLLHPFRDVDGDDAMWVLVGHGVLTLGLGLIGYL